MTKGLLQKISKSQELWTAGRMKDIYSTDVSIEKIKFSSLNRLCVELLYQDKKLIVEPYSFIKSNTGDIDFYGCHHKSKKVDSFKIKEIQSVSITDKPFTPRYMVEIG